MGMSKNPDLCIGHDQAANEIVIDEMLDHLAKWSIDKPVPSFALGSISKTLQGVLSEASL